MLRKYFEINIWITELWKTHRHYLKKITLLNHWLIFFCPSVNPSVRLSVPICPYGKQTLCLSVRATYWTTYYYNKRSSVDWDKNTGISEINKGVWQTGVSDFGKKWVWLAPCETNLILLERAKIYWNLIWKSPIFNFSFWTNLTHLRPRSDIPADRCILALSST